MIIVLRSQYQFQGVMTISELCTTLIISELLIQFLHLQEENTLTLIRNCNASVSPTLGSSRFQQFAWISGAPWPRTELSLSLIFVWISQVHHDPERNFLFLLFLFGTGFHCCLFYSKAKKWQAFAVGNLGFLLYLHRKRYVLWNFAHEILWNNWPHLLLSQDGTSGKTPLHLAVENHDEMAVRHLLQLGAQVDSQMYNDCTPLHLAVGRNDAVIAAILCDSGADTLLRNMENETAQDLADGNDDVRDFLEWLAIDQAL